MDYEDHGAADGTEWRLVRLDADRRLTMAAFRRRRRLRLVLIGLFLAAVVLTAVFAATAFSLPSPYARAALSSVGGDARGSLSATASKTDNEEALTDRSASGPVTWGAGQSGVSCSIRDGALISTGSVSLSDVSLFDGRITASAIELVAGAAATREAVSGGVDVSRVEGLSVDGRALTVSDLPVAIDGLGTLSALERREAGGSSGLDVEVSGLKVRLTHDWRGLPEGSDVVVGMAAACADKATASRLLPTAIAQDEDEGGSASGGSSGGSAGGSSGGSSGSGGGAAGSSGGASGGGSADGGSASADSFRPGDMPAPTKTSGRLLKFAGAVFPIVGKVSYSDDYGAPRAVGGGHTGCDVFARKGAPVVAVQAGVVTEIRYRSLGGNSFHLTNEAGDYFYYAHLLRYAPGLEEGTTVKAGQLLGYVGNTGNAATTPPHLHFEIHPGGGDPVNPFPYLEWWRGRNVTLSRDVGAGDDESEEPSDDLSATASPAAGLRRRDNGVTAAGVAPPARIPGQVGTPSLIPAALSFGVLGGLVTSAVRRRRAEVLLLSIDLGDLRRAARETA